MSKMILNERKSGAQQGLLAVCLAGALAAFGCTTDRTLGNGTPTNMPGVRTTPTAGTPIGSESEPVPPPMTSSIVANATAPQQLRLSPDEAALVVAGHQSRVRILGPASPGTPGRGYVSERLDTGRLVNPALQTNPQSTLNSTISSGPTAGITSGTETGATAAATTGNVRIVMNSTGQVTVTNQQ